MDTINIKSALNTIINIPLAIWFVTKILLMLIQKHATEMKTKTINVTDVFYRLINVIVAILWLPILAALFCIQIAMYLTVIPIYWILTGKTDCKYLYPIVMFLEKELEIIERQEERVKERRKDN